ncbi:hypothetical protein LLU55_004750, partial [Salmonella enterica]|nr:hypothetical protein [Salmonella enterica]
ALAGIKTGTFNFDYRDDFFASLKDGLFFGIIFGIGEWAIRKAKKFDENKKNDRNK